MEELEVIIIQCKPDVIMISETWLLDIVPDEAVSIPNFNLIRKDRLAGRGGGCKCMYGRPYPVNFVLIYLITNMSAYGLCYDRYGFIDPFLELHLLVSTSPISE